MEPTVADHEANFLQALRNEYESRGYSFEIHPGRDRIPAFLGGYEPDAIATSNNESIVIEVKARRAAENEPRLSEIARLVEKQPGWKLRVYYRAATNPRLYNIPTQDEVIKQIAEADRLAASGYWRAAFILGWAALEAAARALNSSDQRSRVMMPRELVEWLAYAGHIEPTDSGQLRKLIDIRNAIVHGSSDVTVGNEEFSFLRMVLQNLVQQLNETIPKAS